MAALLIVRSGNAVVGACGSRCFNADRTRCWCICGGMNHGVGLERATDNTRAHCAEWAARAGADAARPVTFEVALEVAQLPLFDLEEGMTCRDDQGRV